MVSANGIQPMSRRTEPAVPRETVTSLVRQPVMKSSALLGYQHLLQPREILMALQANRPGVGITTSIAAYSLISICIVSTRRRTFPLRDTWQQGVCEAEVCWWWL